MFYVFGYLEAEHHDYPCHEYAYSQDRKYAESFGIIATCATEEEAKAEVRKLESI